MQNISEKRAAQVRTASKMTNRFDNMWPGALFDGALFLITFKYNKRLALSAFCCLKIAFSPICAHEANISAYNARSGGLHFPGNMPLKLYRSIGNQQAERAC